MVRGPAIAAVLILCAAASNAQEATSPVAPPALPAPPPEPSNAPVVDMTHFCRQPSSRGRYYPPHASINHISGHAVVDCALDARGKASQCQVVEEAPAGEDFGRASLILVCRSIVAPAAISSGSTQIYERDGVRRVRETVNFLVRN